MYLSAGFFAISKRSDPCLRVSESERKNNNRRRQHVLVMLTGDPTSGRWKYTDKVRY